MVYLVIACLWLAVGAAVGVIEARHGAWRRGWVVAAMFGPFAIPLAVQRRRLLPPEPVVLLQGRARRGPVDVLVGIDGSASSRAAGEVALGLFGPRARRVTLATVLDLDTAAPHGDSVLYPEPWPEEEAARDLLDGTASALRESSGHLPGTVVLAGDPADALERYAVEEGYEVIVVGCRGRGLSKRVFGSCAAALASKTTVPVLLIPGERAEHGAEGETERAGSSVFR